ncbi:hypothetical protein [Methyloligella solikamskensis]|uniref:Uncharacterized protein n=1 Tax=Methyloligella solikamskensis TaxID=1177756 RepID=A0ABW3J729_9HYPH
MSANDTPSAPLAAQQSGEPLDVADLDGVWQRTLLLQPDGTSDTSTEVYWLQLNTLFGDIRSPAAIGPKDGQVRRCLCAFAGTLRKRDGEIFHWDQDWDCGLPADGWPDEGFLRWEGEVLREDGVHEPYIEHWKLVAEPGEDDFACWLDDASGKRAGLLIRMGAFAYCVSQTSDNPETLRFLLFKQNADGWFLAATNGGDDPAGAGLTSRGLTWPQVLDLAGIKKPEAEEGEADDRSLSMNFEIQGA